MKTAYQLIVLTIDSEYTLFVTDDIEYANRYARKYNRILDKAIDHYSKVWDNDRFDSVHHRYYYAIDTRAAMVCEVAFRKFQKSGVPELVNGPSCLDGGDVEKT